MSMTGIPQAALDELIAQEAIKAARPLEFNIEEALSNMTDGIEQAEWRRMQAPDMARVTAVANVVHPDFFEDEAVFRDRFSIYPAGCFVLARGTEILGYGISHPWKLDSVPALNSVLGELPQ
jgi:hypothetical protein